MSDCDSGAEFPGRVRMDFGPSGRMCAVEVFQVHKSVTPVGGDAIICCCPLTTITRLATPMYHFSGFGLLGFERFARVVHPSDFDHDFLCILSRKCNFLHSLGGRFHNDFMALWGPNQSIEWSVHNVTRDIESNNIVQCPCVQITTETTHMSDCDSGAEFRGTWHVWSARKVGGKWERREKQKTGDDG